MKATLSTWNTKRGIREYNKNEEQHIQQHFIQLAQKKTKKGNGVLPFERNPWRNGMLACVRVV